MAKKEKQVKDNNKHYFREMKAELKKVAWPAPKQLTNNTVAVIAFVLIFAIIVFVLDLCFDSINKYGILKLQQKVQSSFISSDNTENSTTENNEATKGSETNAPEAEAEEQTDEAEQVEVQETPVTSETE